MALFACIYAFVGLYVYFTALDDERLKMRLFSALFWILIIIAIVVLIIIDIFRHHESKD